MSHHLPKCKPCAATQARIFKLHPLQNRSSRGLSEDDWARAQVTSGTRSAPTTASTSCWGRTASWCASCGSSSPSSSSAEPPKSTGSSEAAQSAHQPQEETIITSPAFLISILCIPLTNITNTVPTKQPPSHVCIPSGWATTEVFLTEIKVCGHPH